MIQQAITRLQRNGEMAKLFGYFVVMLILAQPLATMLGQAWQQAHLSRAIIRLRLLVGLSLEVVSVLIFGIFVGLLLMMWFDPKKRWQATLLIIGTGIALLGLKSMGLFLPNIDFLSNSMWLAGGALAGVFAGGGQRMLRTQTAQATEFRKASRGIYLTITTLVIVALLEVHISYPEFLRVTAEGVGFQAVDSFEVSLVKDGIVKNLAVSGVFVFTVKKFVEYDAEENFFVLGPRRSGKSLFLIGAYLEALSRSDKDKSNTPLHPSPDLIQMVDRLDYQSSDWIVESTTSGEIREHYFQYVRGSVFPKNILLSTADYAGEYLELLPNVLTDTLDESDGDETLYHLASNILESDTLILLIDVERFANNDPLEISEYFSILAETEGKDVILVATKADVLAEQFNEERGIEAHRYFEDFTEYVNERLRQESDLIDNLVRDTGGTEIHPVYYQTHLDENGNRVPMDVERGSSVMTVGYSELLDKLGRW